MVWFTEFATLEENKLEGYLTHHFMDAMQARFNEQWHIFPVNYFSEDRCMELNLDIWNSLALSRKNNDMVEVTYVSQMIVHRHFVINERHVSRNCPSNKNICDV